MIPTLFLCALTPALVPGSVLRLSDDASKPAADLVRAETRLATGLYRNLDGAGTNLVFSPASIARVLAMLRECGEGETAEEIGALLGLEPAQGPEVFAELQARLAPPAGKAGSDGDARPPYALESGAALWLDRRLSTIPETVERLRTSFGARAQTLDFDDLSKVRDTVNDWAGDLTHGHVKKLLPEGLPEKGARTIVTDAVWFRSAWDKPFLTKFTRTAAFRRESGSPVDVPMMKRSGDMGYGETERAQVASVPFEDGAVEMLLVLPRPGVTLADASAHEDVETWTKALSPAKVALSLPRFTVHMNANLAAPLQALGVRAAFDAQRSQLTRLVHGDPLVIDAFLHGARIVVDENGAEAAAATAAVLKLAGPRPADDPRSFVADHPFLFLVRHAATGAVLFMGSVNDPSAD